MKLRLSHRFQELTSRFTFSKREQFVGITLILSAALIATQIFSGSLRIEVLLALAGLTYLLSALALHQDLYGWEYLTLFILPTFYTVAVFLFYFLLPERWLTRLPIVFLYALGMYAILLTENIYNVAAERNIQLLRAAHSVGFLLTLLTLFFLLNTILSLHLPFYFIGLLVAGVIFPLALQTLWAMELTLQISQKVWIGSFIVTLAITEVAVALSFWPLRTTIAALLLTTIFYTLTGMMQQLLVERLFQKTIREFITVLVVVFGLVILTTRWGQGFLQ